MDRRPASRPARFITEGDRIITSAGEAWVDAVRVVTNADGRRVGFDIEWETVNGGARSGVTFAEADTRIRIA